MSRFIPFISRKYPSNFNLPFRPQGLASLCSGYLVLLSRIVPLVFCFGGVLQDCCRLPLLPESESSITVLLLFRLARSIQSLLFSIVPYPYHSSCYPSHPTQLIQGKKRRSHCTAGVFIIHNSDYKQVLCEVITLFTYYSIRKCETCSIVSICLFYSVSYLWLLYDTHIQRSLLYSQRSHSLCSLRSKTKILFVTYLNKSLVLIV